VTPSTPCAIRSSRSTWSPSWRRWLTRSPLLERPIYSLVVGVLLGGLLQLAIQLPPLRRVGVPLAPLWEPRHSAVRRVLALLAPSALGAAVYQINVLISTSLASALPAGSVSYLWYAGRVFELLRGRLTEGVCQPMMPLSRAGVVGARGGC